MKKFLIFSLACFYRIITLNQHLMVIRNFMATIITCIQLGIMSVHSFFIILSTRIGTWWSLRIKLLVLFQGGAGDINYGFSPHWFLHCKRCSAIVSVVSVSIYEVWTRSDFSKNCLRIIIVITFFFCKKPIIVIFYCNNC